MSKRFISKIRLQCLSYLIWDVTILFVSIVLLPWPVSSVLKNQDSAGVYMIWNMHNCILLLLVLHNFEEVWWSVHHKWGCVLRILHIPGTWVRKNLHIPYKFFSILGSNVKCLALLCICCTIDMQVVVKLSKGKNYVLYSEHRSVAIF